MGLAVIIPDVSFESANLGKVTLTEEVPIKGLSIVAPTNIVGSYMLRISYSPINTNQRGVIWSIESGSEYARISQDGMLTILEGANDNKIVVKATSVSDTEISSVKEIRVTFVEEGQREPSADNSYNLPSDLLIYPDQNGRRFRCCIPVNKQVTTGRIAVDSDMYDFYCTGANDNVEPFADIVYYDSSNIPVQDITLNTSGKERNYLILTFELKRTPSVALTDDNIIDIFKHLSINISGGYKLNYSYGYIV